MSWSITLTTDRPIDRADAQAIVDSLPAHLRFWIATSTTTPIPFNGWGWSARTDIALPVENTWEISGSYGLSGDDARPMAEYLAAELRKAPYQYSVVIGPMS